MYFLIGIVTRLCNVQCASSVRKSLFRGVSTLAFGLVLCKITNVRKAYCVPFFILINLAIFVLWFIWSPEFMRENFTVSWSLISEGRYWTLLSAAFSHNWLIHFLLNMMVLRSFGTLVELSLGSKEFIKFYLLAAVMSSLGHSFVSAYFLDEPGMAALGASGPIAGVVLVFSLMYPKEKILLFGLIPMPALIGALAFIGLDIWGLIAQAEGGGLPIGHGAHLGGAFTGVIYYFLKLRPRHKRHGRF